MESIERDERRKEKGGRTLDIERSAQENASERAIDVDPRDRLKHWAKNQGSSTGHHSAPHQNLYNAPTADSRTAHSKGWESNDVISPNADPVPAVSINRSSRRE